LLSSFVIYLIHGFLNKINTLEKINILFLKNTDFYNEIKNIINTNNTYGIKILIYPDNTDINYLEDFVIQNKIQTVVLDKDEISRQKLFPLLFKNINFQTFEAFYETIFRKIPIETIDHN
jgi:hypothetical protein